MIADMKLEPESIYWVPTEDWVLVIMVHPTVAGVAITSIGGFTSEASVREAARRALADLPSCRVSYSLRNPPLD